jgi:diguanylate cyclase (GGDEF)-like protein
MEPSTMNEIKQNLLQDLSFGLVLIDGERHVAWANTTAGRMLSMPGAELGGRSLADLPEGAQRLLSAEPRLYMAGPGQWVRRELHRDDSGLQLLVLSDISDQEQLAEENARLRQQVEDLKLTDDLTGLPNKRAISQALELHISRSRRYQNPLSVMLVHIDLQNAQGVRPLSAEPVVLAVSRFLRDRLRWVDQIARWEENLFLLVLPETAEEDARGLLDKISAEQQSLQLPESLGDYRPTLGFGLACWKRGDDMRTLLRAAVRDLQENVGA